MVDQESGKMSEKHINLDRGIFTTADRQYLAWNDDVWSEKYDIRNPVQTRYERKKWISNRLSVALWDLSAANRVVDDDLLERSMVGGYSDYTAQIPYYLFVQSVGFLLRGLMIREADGLDDSKSLSKALEDSVAQMFQGSDQRMGAKGYKNLNVEVEVEGWVPRDKAEAGLDLEKLDDDQLEWLFRMGEISDEEFARAVLSDELKDGD